MDSDLDDDDGLDIIATVSKELKWNRSKDKGNQKQPETIVLPGSETGTEEEYDSACTDDDDLDAPPAKPRIKPHHSQPRPARPTPQPVQSDSESGSDRLHFVREEVKIRTKTHEHGGGEKIIMTEDEEEDVYETWKRSKVEGKRKRSLATTGKAESGRHVQRGSSAIGRVKKQRVEEERNPKSFRLHTGHRRLNTGKPIVGKRRQPKVRKRAIYGDDEDDFDEKLELPAHLQGRKEKIDLAKQSANELAALKLPPTYEDIEFSDDERLEELAERPSFVDSTPPGKYVDIHLNTSLGIIPAPIAQWLRDYQVKGAQFLHESFIYQRGCILGDDMGLGKTVQVIAFLTAAFGKTGDERDKKRMRKMRRLGSADDVWYPRILIVCPGTLMDNWKSELDTWGWWIYDTYHGSRDDKEAALRAAQNGLTEIMITTYTTYKNNRNAINMVPWDCVIADECHAIKERKSDITKAMNEVNALCRIGLTGTALQNKYEELWTLLNWCNPGSVGSAAVWNSTISRPLRLGQSHDATNRQLGNARRIAHQLVNNLLPRMFIRRMKSLIASQLPKKSDRVVFCPLTRMQAEAYERFCDSEAVTLIKYSGEICDCGSQRKKGYCCYENASDGRHWRELVFPCIQNLQKLCNHIANWILLNEEPPEKRAEKLEWLQTCLPNEWKRIISRSPMENYMDPELCGKWIILQKLLTFWHANGDKVLIFSYSIRLLDILRHLFTNTSYNVDYLDGKMTLEDRVQAVSNFNHSLTSFIFLISTRAGGVGLNITRANKVVIFDPSWNPSHDLQAQDRAYRIGQRRDVEVFRLVSAGTIEELVYARQIYKQQQANIGYGASTERRYFKGVMGEEGRKGELFGLVNMFTFHGEDAGQGGLLVKEVVNKTNVAESKVGVMVVGYEGEKEEYDADGVDGEDDPNLGKARGRKQRAGRDEDEEDEDDPISQLTALASEAKRQPKKSSKMNPIQAILAAAGVQYTHENSEVIGSSAIEAQISRRAIEATTNHHDTDLGDTSAFGGLGQQSGTNNNTPPTHNIASTEPQFNADEDTVTFNGVTYHFHPPEDVKKRQFCEMARHFGFESVQEFALAVEGWSQGQRRKALERFYRARREMKGWVGREKEERGSRSVSVAMDAGDENVDRDNAVGENVEDEVLDGASEIADSEDGEL